MVLAATLAACSSSSGASSGGASAGASATSGPTVPAGVDAAVVRKACAAQCSNEFTSIQVYRDERGVARRYERTSNPGSCSHPPTIYFDERGEETGAIPLVPVVPGSDQAKGFDATRGQQLTGLRKAESVMCGKPGSR